MARFQNGWLRKEASQIRGGLGLFCYRQRRQEDGKWVEATTHPAWAPLKELPSQETVCVPVEELKTPSESINLRCQPAGYIRRACGARPLNMNSRRTRKNAQIEKAYSTILKYRRYLKRLALARGRRRQRSPSSRSRLSVGPRCSGRNMASENSSSEQRSGRS